MGEARARETIEQQRNGVSVGTPELRVVEVRCHIGVQVGPLMLMSVSERANKATLSEGLHGIWVRLPAYPRAICIPYANIAFWAVE